MTDSQRIPWGWVGFFGVLVLAALLSLAAGLRLFWALDRLEPAIEKATAWRIIVHGELHLLDEAEYRDFLDALEDGTHSRLSQLQEEADALIQRQVAWAFQPVYQAIPRYADWYYSLTGEYLRYAHALGGGVADFMTDRLEEILFRESGAQARLDSLPARLQGEMDARLQRAGEALLDELARNLPREEKQAASWQLAGEIPLDALAKEELTFSTELPARQLASLGLGAGAAVLVAKGGSTLLVKKLTAKLAGGSVFKAATGIAGKLATKSAVKGGGILAGAGAGTLACAPGGPLALVCGAVAGTLTWLATDLAMLELEEYLDRDELEQEMKKSVEEEQRALESALRRFYASRLEHRMRAFLQRAAASEHSSGKAYRPMDLLDGKDGSPAPTTKLQPARSPPATVPSRP